MARILRLLAAAVTLFCVQHVAVATPVTPLPYSAQDLPWWGVYPSTGFTGSDVVVRPLGTSTSGISTFSSQALATAQYNRSNAQLGWDFLLVNGESPYYNGFIEGYLTADVLMLQGIPAMPTGAVGTWIKDHVAYMQNMTFSFSGVDEFWTGVGERFRLMQGIADGANAALAGKPNKPSNPLTMMDIFLVNFIPFELEDVQIAVKVQQGEHVPRRQVIPGHCSALIKVTSDDLFFAHDTWSGFTDMAYRIFKVYQTESTSVSFSAHPGLIASGDDWYQRENGLAVMETTNGVYNNALYTAVVPQTVSEFLRVAVATSLANDGEEWTALFSRENSGTYNNQYMIVNFNLYVPGASIVPGTLWVAEQLPGYVRRGDQSAILQQQGYWSSYNIPFYPDIYAMSGNLAQYEEYGNFFSYTKYARHEIFARNQSDVTDIASMMQMMRYNNYQADPLSKIQNCSGAPNNQCETPLTSMLSIASRGDLMTIYNTTQENIDNYGPLYGYMAQGCFGAIDAKITSWQNRESLAAWIISGPTNDQVPTFEWGTKACTGTPAPAQTPTTVDFPWLLMQDFAFL